MSQNGAKLGFLIYPPQRNVYVYRPDHIPQRLDNPQSAPGDRELPGFNLDLTEIWQ
jgi:Uma2 family endonuclease